MASKQKQVKILTKSEQKQTIKGIQKPKNIIKNYLESPFALEWPELTIVDEEHITTMLQKSCLGFRRLECKPPWKQVAKYKGANRRSFLMEYNNKFQENLDPDSMKQINNRKKALSHLIFGYNAVMRALEKDSVAGILVKKNASPSFVTKSFLPVCAKKYIPLIPLNDLDIVLKDKETLGLPHACMVLGLKASVKEESNLFNSLYIMMCEALNIEEEVMEQDASEENYFKKSLIEGQENDSSESHILPEIEIESFYLKRNGSKSRRTFIPCSQTMEVKHSNLNADYVAFMSLETQHSTFRPSGTELEKTTEDLLKNFKEAVPLGENLDFDSMIVIDASGDGNQSRGSSNLNSETCDIEISNLNSCKAKQKTSQNYLEPYVPAKTKRFRGNPNRKTMDV